MAVSGQAKKANSRKALKTAERSDDIEQLARRAARISAALARLYPDAHISLDFSGPWQCLVATILSAQCTDERVNRVTPELFRQIPDPASMAAAPAEKVQMLIISTGFFRQKTRALRECARQIVERFSGEVPRRMEDLVALPGVGRKTANVIRGHVYGEPGMVVDTHVRRLSRRLGLSRNFDADKIEADLCELLPPCDWTAFSMRLILHGRRVCFARRPNCSGCALLPNCPQIGVAAASRRAGL
jgi:endonuclease-3